MGLSSFLQSADAGLLGSSHQRVRWFAGFTWRLRGQLPHEQLGYWVVSSSKSSSYVTGELEAGVPCRSHATTAVSLSCISPVSGEQLEVTFHFMTHICKLVKIPNVLK